jgi:hypothetical protein
MAKAPQRTTTIFHVPHAPLLQPLVMEKVMGSRYTARSVWDRNAGRLREMRKESHIRMGWQLEIADCAILGMVVSFWISLLPRSGESLCT